MVTQRQNIRAAMTLHDNIRLFIYFGKKRKKRIEKKKKCLNNWINSGGDDKFLLVQTSWNSLNYLLGQTRKKRIDLFYFSFTTFPSLSLCTYTLYKLYVVTWTTTGKNIQLQDTEKKKKNSAFLGVKSPTTTKRKWKPMPNIFFFFWASVFQTHVASSRLTRCYLISYGQKGKKLKKIDLGRVVFIRKKLLKINWLN